VIPQVHTCVYCREEEEEEEEVVVVEEEEDDDDDDEDDDDDVVFAGPSAPKKKIGPLVPATKFAKLKPRKKTPGASAVVASPSAKGKGKETAGPEKGREVDDTLKAKWFSVNVDLGEVLGEPRTKREERLYGVMGELVVGNRELAEQVASLGNAMLRWKKRFEEAFGGLLVDD